MHWYLAQFRYRTCIWCRGETECTMLGVVHIFEVHQKYKQVNFKRGGGGWVGVFRLAAPPLIKLIRKVVSEPGREPCRF
jgi:hypothetical protein